MFAKKEVGTAPAFFLRYAPSLASRTQKFDRPLACFSRCQTIFQLLTSSTTLAQPLLYHGMTVSLVERMDEFV